MDVNGCGTDLGIASNVLEFHSKWYLKKKIIFYIFLFSFNVMISKLFF